MGQEQVIRHCQSNREVIGVTRSADVKIIKNIKDPMDSIIVNCGGRAQQFIEDEIESWEQVPVHLTEVYYKKGDDESLLFFNFRPKKIFVSEHPNVLVVFRRIGRDNQYGKAGVEEFYIPFNDEVGSIPKIYCRIGQEVEEFVISENESIGHEKYHEIMGLVTELKTI